MATKKPRTLDDFRAEFDPSVKIPAAIHKGLESLRAEEGPEAWEYENDFIRRCKLSNTQMGSYRDGFAKHIVTVRTKGGSDKRVWFADAKVATKARGNTDG
ncbi:MAG: hypothetical protein KGL39_42670 [Patescibacteria group bacterium]|nr:hypothetical protein [Patescibacteria group bacterium]